jgi:hypothetical protein
MFDLQRAKAEATVREYPEGLDYQEFFEDPEKIDEQMSEVLSARYGEALAGMREADPDSYRMVVYGWA